MAGINARDAGDALHSIANKLDQAQVIEPDGHAALCAVARELKAAKRNKHWALEITRGAPVRFKIGTTPDGKKVRPKIDYANIHVDQTLKDRPPFSSFDLAVLLENEVGEPLSRWHIDLANGSGGAVQSGPLFHLQFGGRNSGYDRSQDHPVKEPRWCHPPMELALSCEMIVANFFEPKWEDLREDRSWCENINLFQKICYESYLRRLQQCLDAPSGSTMLRDVWAKNWK